MAHTKEEAAEQARADLSARLGGKDVEVESVEQADFPDGALGAPVEDEMSAMMITPGWRIRLRAGGRTYEYRANHSQLRLYDFEGENYRI
ncbi:MAG TPA: hypothetical protein VEY09_15700 [Pyrinomonadaceae bacterium]|nr:hypothetical protein [Pyrinomonadaceae bacterium]